MGVLTLIRAILERDLSQIAGGAILPTEDDDRMTCHSNQERSPLSRSITYVQKKLFLVNDKSFSIEHRAIVISANNDSFEGDASLDSFLWDQ